MMVIFSYLIESKLHQIWTDNHSQC